MLLKLNYENWIITKGKVPKLELEFIRSRKGTRDLNISLKLMVFLLNSIKLCGIISRMVFICCI